MRKKQREKKGQNNNKKKKIIRKEKRWEKETDFYLECLVVLIPLLQHCRFHSIYISRDFFLLFFIFSSRILLVQLPANLNRFTRSICYYANKHFLINLFRYTSVEFGICGAQILSIPK